MLPLIGLGIAGITLAGTGIQAAYSWIAFNRDNYALNVGWRQNQQYYRKNYRMSWVSVARDDIREMMSVAVHHASSYVSIATMTFSAACLAFATTGFSPGCPVFLTFAFYVSGVVAFIFLLMAILFGIVAQHAAWDNTVELLTLHVRPDCPDTNGHNYMEQAEKFEAMGPKGLFRITGTTPKYHRSTKEKEKDKLSTPGQSPRAPSSSDLGSPVSKLVNLDGDEEVCMEKALEETDAQRAADYLETYAILCKMWEPYVKTCKVAMGFGVICLAQAFGYGTVAKIADSDQVQWLGLVGCAASLAFMYMALMLAEEQSTPSRVGKYVFVLLLGLGPFLSGLGVSCSGMVEKVAVPLAFGSHFAFWVAALLALEWQAKIADKSTADAAAAESPKDAVPSEGIPRAPFGDIDPELAGWDVEQPQQSTDFFDRALRDAYKVSAAANEGQVRRLVRAALMVAMALWLTALAWSICYFWLESIILPSAGLPPRAAGGSVLQPEPVDVSWPNAWYQPRFMACGGRWIFTSDGRRTFKNAPATSGFYEPAQEVQCAGLERRSIKDLSVVCPNGEESCQPAVLMNTQHDASEDRALLCGAANETGMNFGSLGGPVQRLGFSGAEGLAFLLESDALVVAKQGEGEAWVPDWTLADFAQSLPATSAVQSLSSTQKGLFVFRQSLDRDSGMEIDLFSRSTMRRTATWDVDVPSARFRSGCMYSDTEALILSDTRQIFRVSLT
eukprot:TRINITY_DN24402_c0_g1_i1.p1 TRINITY_DN24402_c0_g1~~TRINITY_DN24402_c0_g1_i1.p1  ORF type:complete len:729 (-),score=121.92 TRINITY_DN24402_c0_g1_i1:327-2513(-)